MISQSRQWLLSLDVPPTVFHCAFGLHGELPRERYRLKGLWCVHLYRYVGEAQIAGETYPIRPGYASVVPPDTDLEHGWLHPRSMHISVHFTVSSEDGSTTPLPVVQDLGDRFEEIYTALEAAVGWFATQRRRTEMKVWDALWQLADAAPAHDISEAARHPATRQVVTIIEQRMGGALSVQRLAEEVGLSRNHLTRLFHADVGRTVANYIITRRVERARHLLIYSTMPIKTIAAQVGIPDLHLFNKTIRGHLGVSPRGLRLKVSP